MMDMPLQMGRWAKGLVVASMLLGLSACGETKLLGRSLPDETRVVDGPGLDLPPDFSLRAPEDASEAALRRTVQTGRSAQEILGVAAVSGTAVGAGAEVPAGDQWLLDKAGGRVDPNIRAELSAPTEAEKAAEEEKPGLFQRLFGK
jgi:hypothetical protein